MGQIGLQAVESALGSLVHVVLCGVGEFPSYFNAPLVSDSKCFRIPEYAVAGEYISSLSCL